jgi:hypothetical protein
MGVAGRKARGPLSFQEMVMRSLALSILLPVALLSALAACDRDDAVPTSEDNAAMDAAANGLDNAAADLGEVNSELPAAQP